MRNRNKMLSAQMVTFDLTFEPRAHPAVSHGPMIRFRWSIGGQIQNTSTDLDIGQAIAVADALENILPGTCEGLARQVADYARRWRDTLQGEVGNRARALAGIQERLDQAGCVPDESESGIPLSAESGAQA